METKKDPERGEFKEQMLLEGRWGTWECWLGEEEGQKYRGSDGDEETQERGKVEIVGVLGLGKEERGGKGRRNRDDWLLGG